MIKTSLESRWYDLAPDTVKPIFQLVSANHPLEIYIGRNPSGDYLLLIVTSDRPILPKAMVSIGIEIFEREDNKWSLVFRLINNGLAPLFFLLCEDLIEITSDTNDSKQSINLILRRFSLWQKLLEKQGTNLLDASEIRGLFGELYFLVKKAIPMYGNKVALDGWVGPSSGAQDFQYLDHKWEIKTIRGNSEVVTISSMEQLDSTQGELTLTVIRLGENKELEELGLSLNELVKYVRKTLSDDFDSTVIFESKLVDVSYTTRAEYDNPIFNIHWIKEFEVAEGFPCLTALNTPLGIQSLKYDLDLKNCEPFLKSHIDKVRLENGDY
jgi:Putative  PD-(D/E)XK family member, (DUF4420)